MSTPTPAEARFIDDLGLMLEADANLPRITGRVLGWLLICDPPHQSLTELTTVLGISKASASTAARSLMAVGLVERVAVPGSAASRQDFVRVRPNAWLTLFRTRAEGLSHLRAFAEHGLGLLAAAPPERRERLEQMSRLYTFLDREISLLLAKFEAAEADRRSRP